MVSRKLRYFLSLAVALGFFSSGTSWSSPELDKRFALETVGVLKAWDNVDGLFETYVSESFADVFSREPRFVLHDLSKANELLASSKMPYQKIIEDTGILSQVARSTKSQSVIRTKISKIGAIYRVGLEWLHSPQMDVIAEETFDAQDLSDVKSALAQGLRRLIDKLPFKGHVTGRDADSVTLNIGRDSELGLKVGDLVVIETLEAVKKHPLLKKIVEWRLAPTGRVKIEQIDDRLTFARVVEEEPGRAIARYQKITSILPEPKEERPAGQSAIETPSNEPPRIGWVAGGIGLGSFSRDASNGNGTTRYTGNGFAFGPKADGQIWLTRNWFADVEMNYLTWNYSQKDALTNLPSASADVSSGLFRFGLSAGYSYLMDGTLFGPKGWIRLGFTSTSYRFPTSTTELTTGISFSSIVLGLGGELPIRTHYGFSLDLGFGVLPGASESTQLTSNGTVTSARDIAVKVGLYYWIEPRLRFRFGTEFFSQGADFSTGATVSQKVITFAPAIMYYF